MTGDSFSFLNLSLSLSLSLINIISRGCTCLFFFLLRKISLCTRVEYKWSSPRAAGGIVFFFPLNPSQFFLSSFFSFVSFDRIYKFCSYTTYELRIGKEESIYIDLSNMYSIHEKYNFLMAIQRRIVSSELVTSNDQSIS